MRTVNFRDDVLYALARKMGLDPTSDLLSDQAITFTSFINTWVRKLYDRFDWPEWTIIEQRTPVARYVAWNQAGQNVIGRVFKVYMADPQVNNFPVDIAFKTNQSGIFCGFLVPATGPVWIKYIQPAPKFSAVPWLNTTTYGLGDLVYDPTSGNTYQSLQASNTGNVVTNATWWIVVPFPYIICDQVVRGAYADALRDEGQTDKAQAEEQIMQQVDSTLKVAGQIREGYDAMTDQVPPAPRYRSSAAPTP